MQLVLLRRCMSLTARAVLCQPAGVITAPCRMTQPARRNRPRGLILLAVSPSGTRKTRTKSPRVTLSGRSADNLHPKARPSPRCPFITPRQLPNCQLRTTNCQPSAISHRLSAAERQPTAWRFWWFDIPRHSGASRHPGFPHALRPAPERPVCGCPVHSRPLRSQMGYDDLTTL